MKRAGVGRWVVHLLVVQAEPGGRRCRSPAAKDRGWHCECRAAGGPMRSPYSVGSGPRLWPGAVTNSPPASCRARRVLAARSGPIVAQTSVRRFSLQCLALVDAASEVRRLQAIRAFVVRRRFGRGGLLSRGSQVRVLPGALGRVRRDHENPCNRGESGASRFITQRRVDARFCASDDAAGRILVASPR